MRGGGRFGQKSIFRIQDGISDPPGETVHCAGRDHGAGGGKRAASMEHRRGAGQRETGGVSPGCGSSASGGVSAAALYQADAVRRDAGRYLPQDPAQDPAQLHGGFGKKRFGRNLRPLYNGCGPDRRLCGPAAGKGASGSGGMADRRRAAVLAETCFWGLPPTGLSSAGS